MARSPRIFQKTSNNFLPVSKMNVSSFPAPDFRLKRTSPHRHGVLKAHIRSNQSQNHEKENPNMLWYRKRTVSTKCLWHMEAIHAIYASRHSKTQCLLKTIWNTRIGRRWNPHVWVCARSRSSPIRHPPSHYIIGFTILYILPDLSYYWLQRWL